jgi:hypothetical protein
MVTATGLERVQRLLAEGFRTCYGFRRPRSYSGGWCRELGSGLPVLPLPRTWAVLHPAPPHRRTLGPQRHYPEPLSPPRTIKNRLNPRLRSVSRVAFQQVADFSFAPVGLL